MYYAVNMVSLLMHCWITCLFVSLSAHAVNAVLITNGSPPKKLAIDMSPAAAPNGEFVCYTKRERFVFRPNHLDILEKHFQEDNYPSQEKRELISQLCNNASLAVGKSVL